MGKKTDPESLDRAVCGTCRHWERHPDDSQEPGQDIVGECLWNPPKVLALKKGLVVQASPIRCYRDRCGQHTPQVH